MSQPTFRLPDGQANWPWGRQLNPHYPVVKAEERARAACDLMNLFFLFDELSDVAGEGEVREQANAILYALQNPFRFDESDDSILGEAAHQFARRAIKTLTPASFDTHVEAMIQQAKDRACGYSNRQTVESYMSVGRGTIGAKPAFVFLEGDEDIPAWIIAHPFIEELETCIMDMLIMSNASVSRIARSMQDIYSYNVKQARGDDGHNIVGVVMSEQTCDLHAAMAWVESQYLDAVKRFLKTKEKLPCWGTDADPQVAAYIDGLANWARAGDQWCFETERYFGKRRLEIQNTRRVEMLPKVTDSPGVDHV
ncbi:terpenoid synthase [Neolentinus lepideus HHB14362 ss-1]|uniref:Terpenoid synthase n=1 Tax=Neolentinus lepideus HHB14362 ss-1 TaxID=1314782 RepID=A0A165QRK6_9AGAM|nr:terpenoid synthase [Neolentinus lepideus HHB14362 ss-1]